MMFTQTRRLKNKGHVCILSPLRCESIPTYTHGDGFVLRRKWSVGHQIYSNKGAHNRNTQLNLDKISKRIEIEILADKAEGNRENGPAPKTDTNK